MNIDKKLKKASLEAEKEAFLQLPDDKDIVWTPSEKFEADIKSIAPEKSKGLFLKRRILALSAAALLIAAVAVCVPLMKGEPEISVPDVSAPEVSKEHNDPYSNFYNNAVSDIEIIAQPEYIPEGYTVNSCTVWTDGSMQIEYLDGENRIIFQSYPASEVDLSAFEDIIGKIDINGNDGFAANNNNGIYSNNIAWNDGEYSYIITNDNGVELEELIKVALSVNTEK